MAILKIAAQMTDISKSHSSKKKKKLYQFSLQLEFWNTSKRFMYFGNHIENSCQMDTIMAAMADIYKQHLSLSHS